MYVDAWRRHRERLPLDPLQAHIVGVVEEHGEYHGMLENTGSDLQHEWSPENGATNPFLHMGMHLAIKEQVGTNRPAGITDIHARLSRILGGAHAAEHAMMDCLGETLWRAQRDNSLPDESAYLEALQRLPR